MPSDPVCGLICTHTRCKCDASALLPGNRWLCEEIIDTPASYLCMKNATYHLAHPDDEAGIFLCSKHKEELCSTRQ